MSDNKKSWLDRLKGVITADGLRYTGSEESYLKFLKTFRRTIGDKAWEIEESYQNGDLELCTIKVHALKSSARIIGARDLSLLAEKMENAGRHRDMAFFEQNIKGLLEDYRSYIDNLKDLPEDELIMDKEPISPESLKEAYEALKCFASAMDVDAIRMILDEMRIYSLPETDAEVFEELNRKLTVFDWEGIENLLQ